MKVLMELTEEEGGFIRQKKMFAKAHWPPQLERIFHARPGTDSARPNGRDNFHSLRRPKIAVSDLMLQPTTIDRCQQQVLLVVNLEGRVGSSTDLFLRVSISATSLTIISPKLFGHIAPDV